MAIDESLAEKGPVLHGKGRYKSFQDRHNLLFSFFLFESGHYPKEKNLSSLNSQPADVFKIFYHDGTLQSIERRAGLQVGGKRTEEGQFMPRAQSSEGKADAMFMEKFFQARLQNLGGRKLYFSAYGHEVRNA